MSSGTASSPAAASSSSPPDAWSHDFLSAEELAVIAQRIADQADARHAEQHAGLAVAVVAADELASLVETNRRRAEAVAAEAVTEAVAADEIARL